jgi:hypothetical protein
MRMLFVVALAGIGLAAAGCSKPTEEKTSQDLKAVGSEVGSAAKQVANAPAAKALGADFKQGANELAAGAKEATQKAGSKVEAGAKDAAAKTGDALNTAGDKVKDEAAKH